MDQLGMPLDFEAAASVPRAVWPDTQSVLSADAARKLERRFRPMDPNRRRASRVLSYYARPAAAVVTDTVPGVQGPVVSSGMQRPTVSRLAARAALSAHTGGLVQADPNSQQLEDGP